MEAARTDDGGPVRAPRTDHMADAFVDHGLLVAGVWAHLVAALRGSRAASFRWLVERQLRARGWWVEDPRTGRRLPVLPDGYAEIGLPGGGVHACLVEVDMGSHALSAWATPTSTLTSGPTARLV